MKLNKTRLKQLIQEELQAALSEETQKEYDAKMDMSMREIVARIIKSMQSYGYITTHLEDLDGTYKGDDAKLQEISGVTEQELRKVIALNKKIVVDLQDIYNKMEAKVAANQAGTTPSQYGKTEKSPF